MAVILYTRLAQGDWRASLRSGWDMAYRAALVLMPWVMIGRLRRE